MARTYGFDHFTSRPVVSSASSTKTTEFPTPRTEATEYGTAFAQTKHLYQAKHEQRASLEGKPRAAEPWLAARDEIQRLKSQWVATGKAIGRLPAHVGRSALKRMLKKRK